MKTIFPLIAFLGTSTLLSAQALQSFDTLFKAVTDKYGGTSLEVTNTEATGTITYEGESASTFILTSQKRALRFEVQRPRGTVTFIRQDGRIQAKRGTKTDFPDQSPLYASALNLVPIFALLNLKDDPRFTGSVVQAKDGAQGLSFTEVTPKGFKAPPFPQPKLAATFWLDSAYRIESVSYAYDKGPSTVISYFYTYDAEVTGPFLQANKVESLLGARTLWKATVSAVRKNVVVASDFFKILENRDRN